MCDVRNPMQNRTITRLQETKRGRISVFFDDEFAFSVDKETFARRSLKVGQRFTQAEYEQLCRETQYMRAKEKAFALLCAKSYPKKQLKEKLMQDFEEESVDEVLERLQELGLINDADYAVRCAKDLVNLKHYGFSRVRQELARRGISQNDIEDALAVFEDYDETQAIESVLQKKYRSVLREEKGKRKAFGALVRLGYDAGEVRSAIERLSEQIAEEEPENFDEKEKTSDRGIGAILQKKYPDFYRDRKESDRAIRALMRKGYSYYDIRRVMQFLQEELQEE